MFSCSYEHENKSTCPQASKSALPFHDTLARAAIRVHLILRSVVSPRNLRGGAQHPHDYRLPGRSFDRRDYSWPKEISMTTQPVFASGSPNKIQSKHSALKAEDFINMMVTQLQNQDPLEPAKNSELLAQMS